MNSFKLIITACVLSMILFISQAQSQAEDGFVRYEGYSTSFNSDNSLTFHLDFSIADGYHLIANSYGEEDFFKVNVSLRDEHNAPFVAIRYPSPNLIILEGSEESFLVYVDDLTIDIVIPADIVDEMDFIELPGYLTYYACSNQKCYFGRKEEFHAEIAPYTMARGRE